MEEDGTEPGPATARRRRLGMERCLLCLTLVLLSSSLGLVLAVTQVVGDVERSPAVNASSEGAGNATALGTEERNTAGTDGTGTGSARLTRSVNATGLCVTPECVRLAAQLVQYADPSAEPCQDLHQAACGRWIRESRILGLSSHESGYSISADYVESKVERRLQDLLEGRKSSSDGIAWAQYFYQHCVYEIRGTQSDLDESADFILQEVLGGLAVRRPPDLTTALLRLQRLTASALVDIGLMVGSGNKRRPALVVDLPSQDWGGWAALRRTPGRFSRTGDLRGDRGTRGRRTQPRRRARSASAGVRTNQRRANSRRITPATLMVPPEHDTEHGQHGDYDYGDYGDYDYGDYGRMDGLGWSWDETGDGGPFYGPGGDESDEPRRTASQLYEESKNASLAEMLEEMSSYFWENIVANGHFPEHLATDEIDNMLQFMEDLYKILPTARERVVSEARLHLEPALTVELLQLQYPYLDWERYLSGVTRRPVRGSDPVHVRYPRYMQQLGDLLDRYHPSVVQNAVLLRFRTVFLAEMVDSLVSADTSLPAGQQLCVSLTKEAFPVAVAALYVRNVGKQRVDLLREKVSSILEEIRSELLRSIELKMAASNATRTASDRLLTLAQDKIAATRTYLLAPENLWNDTFVNVNTPPVSRLWKTSPQSPRVLVRPGSKMLLDLFRGLRRAQVKLLKLTLREMASTDPLRWPTEVEPHTANAFHLPARNAVGVPLALLTEPFFHGDVPEYVQFAVLGVVMAHELLHGIDSTGLSFDETGAARHLPAALQQTADEKFQCIRTEYVTPLVKTASSVHQSVDVQLDGDLTLGENSADFSSLSLALSAYLRRRARLGPEPALPGVNLTTQQAFFMSFAQVYCADIDVDSYAALVAASTHPPNPERVNRMARHTAEFAATFSCRPGTPMNPETRCAPLW